MIDKKPANCYPAIYAQILPVIREIAGECGWGIGLHGSLLKDLDLIAIPWKDDATSDEEMVKRIADEIGGKVGYMSGFGPGHRKGFSIIFDYNAHGKITEGYVDFSIADPRQ